MEDQNTQSQEHSAEPRMSPGKKRSSSLVSLAIAAVLLLGLGFAILSYERSADVGDRADEIAEAPRAYLSPSVAEVAAGEELGVAIMLDTNDMPLVAVRVEMEFDPALLEVMHIDYEDGAFDIEAEHLLEEGRVIITRGQPTPGVSGSEVMVGRVYFAAKAAGTADVRLVRHVDGSEVSTNMILDDGAGTDVLRSVSGGTYTIN